MSRASLDGSEGVITVTDMRADWKVLDVDMRSGAVRRRLHLPSQPQATFGIGTILRQGIWRRCVAASYVLQGHRRLQIGTRHWDLSETATTLEVEHARGPYYTFRVLRSGEVEYAIKYWSSLAWCFRSFDPVKDLSEGDFFLEVWALWRREVAELVKR